MAKIRSIKFKNHPVFKDAEFNFETTSGEPAEMITLAGENGSGKTKLLEELYYGTRQTYYSYVSPSDFRQTVITLDLDQSDLPSSSKKVDGARLISSYDIENEQSFNKVEFFKQGKAVDAGLLEFSLTPAFSTTEINFSSNEIPDHLQLERFTDAFIYMFGNDLRYKTILEGRHQIFEKDGKGIDLDALSSGEKQIIFRSVLLLGNPQRLKGSPVLIDEPELSMHPRWAHKVYGFYKSLFMDKKGGQTSQIFIATHSADVVKAAMADEKSIVLSLCLDCMNYKKYSKDIAGELLPTITMAEIKYLIFGLPSTDLHVHLYSYLQNTYTNTKAIHGIDDFLLHHKAPKKKFVFQKTTYNALPTYIRNAIDHPDSKYTFTDAELEKSIDYMIGLVKKLRQNNE